jgi:hypothetical protein
MRCIEGLLCVLLMVPAVWAQNTEKYNGPRPPKPDVPYLLEVNRLIETEVSEASQSAEKNGTVYSVKGTTSPVRSPMAEPIFLFQASKLNPDRLSLFKMAVKGGDRTLFFPAKRSKDGPKPIYLMVTPLGGGLFKVEVNEFINDGDYCLSPDGSTQVFCFATY